MKKVVKLSTLIMVNLFVILCALTIIYPKERLNDLPANTPINIIGTYSIDNGEKKDISEEIDKELYGYHTIIIRGHFQKAIKENELIIVHSRHGEVSIKVNGSKIFEFGQKEKLPIFSHSSGNVWKSFVSKGITPDDKIEIQIKNSYKYNAGKCFNTFIRDFQSGYMCTIYEKVLRENRIAGFVGLLILSIGVEGLLIWILSLNIEVIPSTQVLAYSLYAFCAGIWIFCDSNSEYISFIIPNSFLNGIMDMITLYFLPITIVYLCYVTLKSRKQKKNIFLMLFLLVITTSVLIIVQMTGYGDLYETQSVGIFVNNAIMLLGSYCVLSELKVTKDKNIMYMLVSFMPICICGSMESINFYMDIMPSRILMRSGIIISIFFHLYALINYIKGMIALKEKAKKLEKQIVNMRIEIMLSQIQPHFLFNSLIAIKQLCDINPSKASQAVEHFSFFLRSNLDSLGSSKCIEFGKELNHVKNYLYLEKLRFEERLKIKLDINVDNFLIPPLTLQPLVENAVRYGVTKKREGGIIKIKTFEDKNNIYVIVEDNGRGFNVNDKKDDGRNHVGIENVRSRIYNQCNGELIIESRENEGTKAKIIIPKSVSS